MSTLKVNTIQNFSTNETLRLKQDSGTGGEISIPRYGAVSSLQPIGITGSLETSGSITPSSYNQFDIGSNSKQWRSGSFGYVSGSAGEFGHLKLGSGSGVNVGATNVRIEDLPTSDPSISGRLFTQSGSQLFSGDVTASGDFNISSSVFMLISQG